ncbi:hypothetical protein [Agaribacterium sp. ZY112]|uniref:hypothetical protein n=1 Tax=Agaribacterium sp. ZY112 TaxID=3233574 RepID=UPI0035258278
MKTRDDFIQEISSLVLRCKDVVANDWDGLTFVFDVADGHIANSGFLYSGDKIRPATARIKEEPLLLSGTIKEFRQVVANECGEKFKQLLIQIEKESGHFKIDFEFDDAKRWAIVPSKMKEMREALRPKF